jgi:outer membrane lipoprotein-sorting protein
MTSFRFWWGPWLAVGIAMGLCGGLVGPIAAAPAGGPKTGAPVIHDEPAAHALYDQMVATMRKAKSLSFVSHYKFEARGMVLGDCTYRVWLKKPNYFRVEAESVARGFGWRDWGLVVRVILEDPRTFFEGLFKFTIKPAVNKLVAKPEKRPEPRPLPAKTGKNAGVKEIVRGGTLIGDGNTLWIYWPQGHPRYDNSNEDAETRRKTYMMKPAPPGCHSIGHEVIHLGAGACMPIIDPSTFHGYTDSLQAYLDGVKGLGTEKVGSEDCDKIEVSIMKGQRSWYLWLSKRDHLPRKLRQIVRVSHEIVIEEQWSSVTLNAEMAATMFAWKPPAGWKQWKLPEPKERLLKPGVQAPDFDLASADGKRIKLSDYRGQIVWLYVWRAG